MIDYWCNAFTPDREARWSAVIAAGALSIRTRAGDADDGFVDTAGMVERMDRHDVATLVLPVCDVRPDAPVEDFAHYAARRHEIRSMSADHPGRFVGVWSVDPDAGDVGAARDALGEPWCVGLHTHTHSWNLPFDDPAYVPFYEACAGAGVPFVMQAGGSGGHFPDECAHPRAIAAPAAEFASVTFVLSHTGSPWVAETIAAATTHANVVVGTATHPPRRWPAELVDFIRGPGRTRTLFGTGFPLTGHIRSRRQLDELALGPETVHDLLEGNARRAFTRIPDRVGG